VLERLAGGGPDDRKVRPLVGAGFDDVGDRAGQIVAVELEQVYAIQLTGGY
jgi:hypothetical protein